MILYIFLLLFIPLFFVFSALAFSFKSLKIYWTGAIVSLFYFTASAEGLVYAFKKKIPMDFITNMFIKNPFTEGTYRFLLSNYHFNKNYYYVAVGLVLIGALTLLVKIRLLQRQTAAPLK
jgi:hypothetical protein